MAVVGVPATVPVDTTVGAAAIVGGLIVPGTVAAGEAGDGAEAAGAGSLWPEQPGISDVLHMMPLRKAAVSRPLLMLDARQYALDEPHMHSWHGPGQQGSGAYRRLQTYLACMARRKNSRG